MRDLRRMKSKQLSDRELEILENKPFEKTLLSLYIRHGMQKSLDCNIHIGRPKDKTESIKKFLTKEKNKPVIKAIEKGLSLRACARETGVSINTVRKVKAAMSPQIEN